MVKVQFLGPIQKEPINLDVSSISQLGEELKKIQEVAPWLEKCAVAVNDEVVTDRDRKLKDGDIVSLLPPVCGG